MIVRESKNFYNFKFVFSRKSDCQQFVDTYVSILQDVRMNDILLVGRISRDYCVECVKDLINIYDAQIIELK
jgi:hypothetical protein